MYPSKKELGVKEMLEKLLEEKEFGEKKEDTKKDTSFFKWPGKWKSAARKSNQKDQVLVFYLNIKGELEAPRMVPIYSGNMVIIKNKVHEIDPRSLWTTKVGFKTHKLVIIREIDRRPVSNLDWDEIRKRGDATDSDEFLIKAALKAQIGQASKPLNKTVMIVLGVAVVALLIFLFSRG